MVPMSLSIAWKTTNKPLLNTHPRIPMKWELSNEGGTQKERNQKPIKIALPKISLSRIHKKLNKNPSSPKRVHFINSIVILSIDSGTKKEDDSSTNACDLNLGGMVKGKEEVKEKDKEEYEMETDMEVEEVIEEEKSEFKTDKEVEEIFEAEEEDEDDENFNSFPTMKELSHHEWLLKNP
ncbi:hypothetical protein Tco_1292703 [Tanacetum coccineum]